jgi:integrase/recombinase XerD
MTWIKEETMLVQPVVIPGSGTLSWTVLGDDDVPVAPVDRFLAYLTDIGRSPNAVKAYAHDLKDYWDFIGFRGLDWREARLGTSASSSRGCSFPRQAVPGRSRCCRRGSRRSAPRR